MRRAAIYFWIVFTVVVGYYFLAKEQERKATQTEQQMNQKWELEHK